MKIAYVVLHYLATQDTIECVESIIKNISAEDHDNVIIVVDNGSPNSSYSDLKEAFNSYSKVKLIKSEENLGFAKGNNLGYKYAKYNLGADFIVLLNNDTVISQKDFSDIIVKKFKEKRYFVLGPDIVTADGYHQNPGCKQTWGLRELCFFRLKKRIRLMLSYFHLDSVTTKMIAQVKNVYRDKPQISDVENTILHGACLVFSPLYVNRFDGLHEETFLYMEEDILKLYADFYGFLMMYSSDLCIFHKEDAATNMVQISNDKRTRLKYKRLIESSKIYSKLKRNMIIKKKILNTVEKAANNAKEGGYSIDFDMPISYLSGLIWQRGWMLVRGIFRSFGMKSVGKKLFVGKNVTLKCKSKMNIGNGVTIQDKVYIDALSRKGLFLEDGSSIGSGTIIRCSGNFHQLGSGFRLGKNSSLADNCFIGATGGVYIGDNVIGGQNIRFHSSNHIFEDKNILIKNQGIISKGIIIGDNCWIGAGVVFCDGVTVGSGCVIGANAVVTKDIPDSCVIAGNPARIIRCR